jgi:hypothetical protein
VANRPLAAPDRLGDLRDRHTRVHQRGQLLSRQAALGLVLAAISRLQPVFLDPVADRRFMQIEAPADLRQRQTLPEKLLKRSAIHALHCRANICSCL